MASSLVVITGASSGIGEATAKLYASQGAKVVLLARSKDRLDLVAGEIRQAGGMASPYPIDLADSDAVSELGQRIGRELGTPDILINNAGAGRWLPFLETSPEDARAMIALPYLAAFYMTRALLPAMLARGSGSIACIAYPAARRALSGFTEALRTELRGKGIAITLVVLGMVESSYWQHNPGSRENVPKATKMLPVLSPEEAAEAIYSGVSRGSRTVIKPFLLRPLFLLNAFMPRLVEAQMRRMSKPRA